MNSKVKSLRLGLLKYTWRFIAVWTFIVIGLMIHGNNTHDESIEDLIILEARAHFKKDKVFRYWSAIHGGFYVPISERTQPSPYLAHIPERDIETPDGKQLTLMNPAWALRQMNEDFAEIYGVVGHITSLMPLRTENAADEWESKALKLFENGETEVSEFIEFVGQSSFRLMKPLIVEEGCLKCHGHQGYEVGDVRGGVSVAVPLEPYSFAQKHSKKHVIPTFLVIWTIGFGMIILGSRSIGKNVAKREQVLNELQNAHDNLESHVKKRTAALDSEKKFSDKIINTSNAIIVGLDRKHKIKIFNNGAEKITGYKEREVIGKDWFKIFFMDDMFDKMEEVWNDSWKESSTSHINPILIKSGEERIISWQSAKIYRTAGNKDDFLISIGEDITERKAEEAKLKNKNYEMSVLNEATVGRELKVIELKKEINKMLEKSGEEPKYQIIS